MAIGIAVINQSTLVALDEIRRVTAALQKQLDGDYAAIWGLTARLEVHEPASVPPDAWQLVVLDDSDQANALGYHELTSSGRPLGKVFVRSVQQSGGAWSVAASHELLEMMADPDINLAAEGYAPNDRSRTAFYAYENCDPVEGDVYDIDGVSVSDFAYPEFFEIEPAGGARFDQLALVKAPFTLRPGGYMSYILIGKGEGWKQIFGDASRAAFLLPRPGGRRFQRMMPRRDWKRSRT